MQKTSRKGSISINVPVRVPKLGLHQDTINTGLRVLQYEGSVRVLYKGSVEAPARFVPGESRKRSIRIPFRFVEGVVGCKETG